MLADYQYILSDSIHNLYTLIHEALLVDATAVHCWRKAMTEVMKPKIPRIPSLKVTSPMLVAGIQISKMSMVNWCWTARLDLEIQQAEKVSEGRAIGLLRDTTARF